ncbi:MAG TPA: cyclodeaminase/cyclohydrolase family protein [Thermotogota bacterium]|nr:cyclodeaminase/cyclohydrolase family protein [Thermotogota bacterium]
MFRSMTLESFLDQLASKEPTPGGGTAAALAASTGAALVEMVARLSIGKKGYELVQSDFQDMLKQVGPVRDALTKQMDLDAEVFDQVMDAFQLPRKSEEEKQARKHSIQIAMKEAALVPLDTCSKVCSLLPYALFAAEKGNRNAVSDAFCALELLRAAFHMACENVEINLASISDTQWAQQVSSKLTQFHGTMERAIERANELKQQ